MSTPIHTIIEHLERHYDIAPIASIKKIDRGFVNDTYIILTGMEAEGARYCIRCYNEKTTEQRIQFEHHLLEALRHRNFPFSPRLVPSKTGRTWYRSFIEQKEGYRSRHFFAAFHYVDGEDTYTWDQPLCTYTELGDCAQTLAAYHRIIADWKPPFPSEEVTRIEALSTMGGQLEELGRNALADKSRFGRMLSRKMGTIIRDAEKLLSELRKHPCQALPHLAIHGDFHPGNLRFENGRVKGMFDFDWAAMAARCFDVGMALMYFCTDWRKGMDGRLMTDRLRFFLDTYQRAMAIDDAIGPLNREEMQAIPWMIRMGHLIMIHWAANEFYTVGGDDAEFSRCTRHCIRALEHLHQHAAAIKEKIRACR